MSRSTSIGFFSAITTVAILVLLFLNSCDGAFHSSRILLQDAERIDRVILSDRYDSVVLVREEGLWLLDEGEPALSMAVENLLYAAANLEIVSVYDALPEGASDQVIRVRFERQGKEVLSYRVYNHKGRFLVALEGAASFYSMTLPGYSDLDLGRVFSVHTNHYREHVLIDLLPSEIGFLEVQRREEAAFRFEMDASGDIQGLVMRDSVMVPTDSLEDLAVRLLFSYFTHIRFERKLEGGSDTVVNHMVPDRYLARLSVGAASGELYELEVYSMPGPEGRENHKHQALVRVNGDTDPMVVNYIFLDVLMRPLRHYYVDKQDI